MKGFKRYKHFIFDHIRYLYYAIFNDKHKLNMRRFKKCDRLKPRSQIKTEIKSLKDYWGCLPMQYYTFDFYSSDCKLSLEEMKDYIPGYFFYKVLYPRFDDIAAAFSTLENKYETNCLFRKIGIPINRFLFLKKGDFLLTANSEIVNQEKFDNAIDALKCNKIFVKPINGRGGKGILIAHRCNDMNYTIANTILCYSFVKSLSGDYLIEPAINQIDYLNNIYPHSVNTLRAITKRNETGKVTLVGVTLRMGNCGREIDNGSAGGFLIGINLETGTPLRDYASYNYGTEKFYSHPDTGFVFADIQVPNWQNIKQSNFKFCTEVS